MSVQEYVQHSAVASELWAELSLFGVAAADQHKLGRMPHTQPLPFDHVLSRGGHVEERVHDMVLQQIDLVHIKKTAVGLCQETGLKRFLAANECALNIQSADYAIFRRAQWQVDNGNGDGLGVRRI